jgi:hypothetical protein
MKIGIGDNDYPIDNIDDILKFKDELIKRTIILLE